MMLFSALIAYKWLDINMASGEVHVQKGCTECDESPSTMSFDVRYTDRNNSHSG